MLPVFSHFRHKLPQLALVFITLIWGGTFLTVQYGLNFSSPILFVALRFAVATMSVSLLYWHQLKGMSAKDIWAGAVIGMMIAFGYATQTMGLQSITSSESALLTALYLPLVPILLWIFFKKQTQLMTWFGASLAFIGLILLTGNPLDDIQFNRGQLLTLMSAVSIALEIIFISYFAEQVNLKRVTVLQLLFASIFCFLAAPLAGETQLPSFDWHLVAVLFGLGIASAIIQLIMNWAQRQVDPAQAAMIYAGEPIWATLFGRIAGERLTGFALYGGLLVILGVLCSEIKFKGKKTHG